nr:hypothetical protein [Tanacetum cinerariifolium]
MGYEKPSTMLTFYKAFFSSQWKFLIHTILQSLSAKRTSWNEFSLPMASAVICLSTGRKFNFSKYIFESLVRNVDSSSKFYMYPRFIYLIIQNQLGDLSTHSTKYISPTLTQKVFANMRRVGKGCSGVETPLFEGMLVVREPEEQGDAEEQDKDEGAELMNENEEKETEEVQDTTVKVVVPSIRRRRGVVIRDPEEESSAKTLTETKSKDKGKGIIVEEPKPMKKKQQVELDEAYARKLQEELNQDIDWEVAITPLNSEQRSGIPLWGATS